jgi:hypothetical protein
MTDFKDYIGGKDIKHWDGVTRTFDRSTSTGGTLSQNKVGEVVDILEVYGSGTAYTLSTLSSAIDRIGTSNQVGILLQPGTWTITDDQTVPSNIHLIFPPGASMSISNGKTLTINGGVIAGPYEIFSSTGTIDGTPTAIKDSNWVNGTVTDSATWAVQIDSDVTLGGTLAVTGATTLSSTLAVDTINEKTSAAGVTCDGVLLKDSEVTTDVINEKTAATGVTADGVLMKDNDVTATDVTANTSVITDTISEKTGAAGVTIDSFGIKDNAPNPSSWPAFSVNKGGDNQALSDTNVALITWSNEEFDTNSDFANNRFTPTVAGKYLLTAKLTFLVNAQNDRVQLYIRKNGATDIYGSFIYAFHATQQEVDLTAIVDANGSSDYFEIWGRNQDSADTIQGTSAFTYWMGSRIA